MKQIIHSVVLRYRQATKHVLLKLIQISGNIFLNASNQRYHIKCLKKRR